MHRRFAADRAGRLPGPDPDRGRRGRFDLSSYTPITASDQALWSTGAAQIAFIEVDTDLRVQNLFAYPDAIGPGTTNYTDNLTYTVVAQ